MQLPNLSDMNSMLYKVCLDSEFSFSYAGCVNAIKEPILHYHFAIAEQRRDVFTLFPKAFMDSETWSSFWKRVPSGRPQLRSPTLMFIKWNYSVFISSNIQTFRLDLAQGCINGTPIETQTHSWRLSSLLTITPSEVSFVIYYAFCLDVA